MITVDAREAIADLQAMVARMLEPEPLLAIIGNLESEAAKERIEATKTDPLGAAWQPWAGSTYYQRERKGTAGNGILYDTGDLLESIHYEIEGPSVAIGSDLDYARFLQEGTVDMPARPFLGWTPEGLTAYEAMLVRYIETGAFA